MFMGDLPDTLATILLFENAILLDKAKINPTVMYPNPGH